MEQTREYCAWCEKEIPSKYFASHLHLDEIDNLKQTRMVRTESTLVQAKVLGAAEIPPLEPLIDEPMPTSTRHTRNDTFLSRIVTFHMAWAHELDQLIQDGKSYQIFIKV